MLTLTTGRSFAYVIIVHGRQLLGDIFVKTPRGCCQSIWQSNYLTSRDLIYIYIFRTTFSQWVSFIPFFIIFGYIWKKYTICLQSIALLATTICDEYYLHVWLYNTFVWNCNYQTDMITYNDTWRFHSRNERSWSICRVASGLIVRILHQPWPLWPHCVPQIVTTYPVICINASYRNNCLGTRCNITIFCDLLRFGTDRFSTSVIVFMMTSSNGKIFRVTGPLTKDKWPKDKWRVGLMFSLVNAWINGWVNNREAGDLRRHHAHYDAIAFFMRLFRYQ